ncbi:hypothetical protein ESA94_15610 [Lacibacter luteus]|uniref:DUF3575 domain-containing protein n=1 Tax=Lacibacter luteus TaxID=2508719 RepID=A0A4Q1CGC6_9BACT|nr:hypothetical protein [Lacibacter luteus]RXK58815.1 hypothetical protein ESA94_15610 [Lacibacter luteus]
MRNLIILFLLLFSSSLIAQKSGYVKPLFTATIISPGLAYEHPVSDKLSIKTKAAFSFGWSYSYSSSLGSSSSFSPAVLAALQLRYYYNFELRERKGKITDRNSVNYISLLTKYAYSGITYYHNSQGNYSIKQASHLPNVGIVWGIQRNYKNRFSFDCSIGPSIYSPLVNNEFSFIADVSLGIWLGKKVD